ncbi:exonuclease [Gordonia phage Gsput1]|uniref:Phosphatase n=1 Tax=Gordonia phage Gsput1 TaxID=1622193 RepID=A0A0E3XB74_9CAUD|nr:exonuclease [Gordonia phage Gsput1]AKC03082.1 phosphatase [Gordonia phage Gsput1]
MGALAKLLDVGTVEVEPVVDELAVGARTVRVNGYHDGGSDDELLRTLEHDPERWRFAAPPAVYRKLDEAGEVVFTTYRYNLVPVPEYGDLAKRILSRKLKPTPRYRGLKGGGAFTFQSSDLQLGKSDNGGTEAIVEGYLDSVQRALDELKRLRKSRALPIIHLPYPGDCIEGNQSQGGRNMWRTDMTVTEQTRIFRHLMYVTIEAFAPLADRVLVDVVNGNHDEMQRFQTTRPDDGHATESAIAVREGLARNPDSFGHVEVRVPPLDQPHMTVPVGDSVFTIAHGDKWRKGKAMEWWSGQTFYRHSASAATILIHGHFHEFELERAGARFRVCSPTYDRGSNYYRDMTGAVSTPGGVVYVSEAGAVRDLTLV